MLNKKCPQCLKILADKNRAKIIHHLKRQKRSNVKEISSLFLLRQPTISHHLKALKEIGILKSKKIGKEVYYFLNKKYSCHNCHILQIPIFKK